MAKLSTRDQAKTMIYCLLYGGGDAKLGTVVGGSAAEGKALKQRFFKGVPAYKKLVDSINKALILEEHYVNGKSIVRWRKRYHRDYPTLDCTHCLLGLDGRLLYVRSPHSALNTLLQSAGALICKKWVVTVEENMRKAGYNHGDDFRFQAWVHSL